MSSNWSFTTSFLNLINQGALEIGDGYRAKNDELGGSGVIFLRAGHVKDDHIDFSGVERFYSESDLRLLTKSSQAGDTVVTTKGNSTGRTSYVHEWMPQFVYSPHLSYWRSLDPNVLDGGFLRYWSKSREFIRQLDGMKISTDMAPYLSLGDQKRLSISIPAVNDQKAIAHILGTLDDKIELNRKTNETLEAMAKALFKSWFVDFAPVRAKAEGRPTGLPGEISDLFPDSFEESELGKIPRGWGVAAVGDLVDCVGGSTPSTSEPSYWDGGENLWATPKDLSSLPAPFLLDTAKRITESGIRRISSGVLPVGSVLLSSRAPVGYVALTCVPVSINQGFIALMSNELMPSPFLLNWCLSNVQQFKDRASGTTFAEISKAAFRPIPILVPDQRITKLFAKESQSLYDRIVSSMKQSDLLESCRDILLPKLISGELRIPDAEQLVEAAGL